jgi:hypothetical protein
VKRRTVKRVDIVVGELQVSRRGGGRKGGREDVGEGVDLGDDANGMWTTATHDG